LSEIKKEKKLMKKNQVPKKNKYFDMSEFKSKFNEKIISKKKK